MAVDFKIIALVISLTAIILLMAVIALMFLIVGTPFSFSIFIVLLIIGLSLTWNLDKIYSKL